MRSAYQPVSSVNRMAASNISIHDQTFTPSNKNTLNKSPIHRQFHGSYQNNIHENKYLELNNKLTNSVNISEKQSNGQDNSKNISCSMKNISEKISSVEHLIRNNNNLGLPFKKEPKDIVSHYRPNNGHTGQTHQENEELRTSCPNVFRKFQYNSTLRSTTHNNPKFGAVMAEIKKQQQEDQGIKTNMKFDSSIIKNLKRQSSDFNKQKKTFNYNHEPKVNNFKQTMYYQSSMKKLSLSSVSNKNIINGFEISKQLGKGKFGEVNLARHIETNFIVALKKIDKAKMKQYKMVEQFKRQIKLHSVLDHPNIVKFYGFFQNANDVYLILQYISGGTLFDYLGEREMLDTEEAAEYLRDTIQAVTYMHERSIAHRDIKPENIVLTNQGVAKVCDFGWSALVQSSRTTYCGTFDYAPPQILQRKNYDTAVDIWCLGVLTYEMLTGRVPFQGQKRNQIMQKIISVDKNRINYNNIELPADAKDFIESLVQKDPRSRPKCKDLLKHRFFENNLKNSKK